jgi:hypothetical protein
VSEPYEHICGWATPSRYLFRPSECAACAAEKQDVSMTIADLAEEPCENLTRGTCADDPGKSPDARYLADRYCWPCRIRHVLALDAL